MKRHDDQSVRKGCGDGVKLRDNGEGEERRGERGQKMWAGTKKKQIRRV